MRKRIQKLRKIQKISSRLYAGFILCLINGLYKCFRSITQTIARKIGGDVQKTESELLSALLGTSLEQKGSLR